MLLNTQLRFLDPPCADHMGPPSPDSSEIKGGVLGLQVLAARGDVRVWWGVRAASLLHPSPESDCPGSLLPVTQLVLTDGELCCVDPFFLWLGERGTTLSEDSLESNVGK